MKFGLSQNVIENIQEVFTKHLEVEKAILYGSRALGRHRPSSDIDIVLFGKFLDLQKLFNIEDELDDLLLPYKFDISLYANINNRQLLDHIKRVGKVLYKSTADSSA